MAKKKIQRRKMAPRAVALLAGIALLLAVIVIFVSGRQMRNNGRRYARKLGEQIGMSVATAAEAAKVEFVNASAYPSVTRAAGTPYLFESPKTTEANGATLPQWVIFCNAVNDTVTEVIYYDYRQLERFGHGVRLRGHVDPASVMTDMKATDVQSYLGFLPLRRMYSAEGMQEAYKYWYIDDSDTAYEVVLYVNYSEEGYAQSAAELKTEFIVDTLTVR